MGMKEEINAKHQEMIEKALDTARAKVREAALQEKAFCIVSSEKVAQSHFIILLQRDLGEMFKVESTKHVDEGDVKVWWTIPLTVVHRIKSTLQGWGD